MGKVCLFVRPEIADVHQSGKNAGDHEGFIHFVNDGGKLFNLFLIGHAVFNQTLPCGAVIRFRHIPAGCLVAQTLTGCDQSLLKLREGCGICGLPKRIDHGHIITGVQFLDHAGRQSLAIVGVLSGIVRGRSPADP